MVIFQFYIKRKIVSEIIPISAPKKPKRYYLVVDFEATCWPEPERRGDAEIIEFGCVKMSRKTHRILGEFNSFVRPVRYPTLSSYCTGLTNIQQSDVDAAPVFSEVLAQLVEWLGDPSLYTFCSWGAYDHFLLRQACRFHRLDYPFDDEYLNIKPAFSEAVSGQGRQHGAGAGDARHPAGRPHTLRHR